MDALKEARAQLTTIRDEVLEARLRFGDLFLRKKRDENFLRNSLVEAHSYNPDVFNHEFFGTLFLLEKEINVLTAAIEKDSKQELAAAVKVLVEPCKHKGFRGDALGAYTALQDCLAGHYENGVVTIAGTPLQDALLSSLFNTRSPFLDKCASYPLVAIGATVKEEFQTLLDETKPLLGFDLEATMRSYLRIVEGIAVTLGEDVPSELRVSYRRRAPSIQQFKPAPVTGEEPYGEYSRKRLRRERSIRELKRTLVELEDWSCAAEMVAATRFALLNELNADLFTIVATMEGITLTPQEKYKRVRMADLVGYDQQKAELVRNVESLLAGEDANNMFLYGPPGTGKSATVNALLTEYAPRGLCVVELPKEHIPAIPAVFVQIAANPEKKFLFVVDEFDIDRNKELYTGLKTIIEGSFTSLPENARFCVQSNNEEALRPGFSCKGAPQNSAALEDRFGLVVYFGYPNEEERVAIFEKYLTQRGIETPVAEVMDGPFKEYCDRRKITEISPRHIRDFVRSIPKKK